MGELWQRTVDDVRGRLNGHVFNTWFRPMRCVAEREDRIVLAVPNRFFLDWVVDHYRAYLVDVLRAQAAREIEIEFTVDAEAPPVEPEAETAGQTSVVPMRTGRGAQRSLSLNPKYTFENYVVGQTNQFAVSAANSVAEAPGQNYNPLFLYGGSGLGKTHLLNAIAVAILDKRPTYKINFLSTEQFTNEFIASVRENRMKEFRQSYREQCDCLLLDDIQFIAGKEQTEEEFFHTFNELHGTARQIVVTSDRPQEQIHLAERLKSRFQWGLTIDIQPPAFETRVAILEKKAQLDGILLPGDVAQFIATHIKSNVRELEGSLTRLEAFASLTGAAISVDLAREVLKNVLVGRGQKPTVEAIQKVVASYYNVKLGDLNGERRHKQIAHARQVAMYLARSHTDASYPDIGKAFGGKDHSTVMSAVKKIARLKESDQALRATLETLERNING